MPNQADVSRNDHGTVRVSLDDQIIGGNPQLGKDSPCSLIEFCPLLIFEEKLFRKNLGNLHG
jgi:hypothetical protein